MDASFMLQGYKLDDALLKQWQDLAISPPKESMGRLNWAYKFHRFTMETYNQFFKYFNVNDGDDPTRLVYKTDDSGLGRPVYALDVKLGSPANLLIQAVELKSNARASSETIVLDKKGEELSRRLLNDTKLLQNANKFFLFIRDENRVVIVRYERNGNVFADRLFNTADSDGKLSLYPVPSVYESLTTLSPQMINTAIKPLTLKKGGGANTIDLPIDDFVALYKRIENVNELPAPDENDDDPFPTWFFDSIKTIYKNHFEEEETTTEKIKEVINEFKKIIQNTPASPESPASPIKKAAASSPKSSPSSGPPVIEEASEEEPDETTPEPVPAKPKPVVTTPIVPSTDFEQCRAQVVQLSTDLNNCRIANAKLEARVAEVIKEKEAALAENRAQATGQLKKAAEDLAQVGNRLGVTLRENEKLKNELDLLKKQADSGADQLKKTADNLVQMGNRLGVTLRENEKLKNELDLLKGQANSGAKGVQDKLDTSNVQVAKLKTELEVQLGNVKSKQAEVEVAKKEIDALNGRVKTLEDGLAKKSNDATLTAELGELRRQIKAKDASISQLSDENKLIKANYSDLEDKLKDAKALDKDLIVKNQRLEGQVKRAEDALVDLERRIKNAEQDLVDARQIDFNAIANAHAHLFKIPTANRKTP